MVGVPLSRGCQACRRRKVKCDEKRPSCSKCTNRGMLCPGYPTRLKFMDDGLKFEPKSGVHQRRLKQSPPRSFPTSPSEKLSLEIYQTFEPSLPAVKSLASFSKTIFVSDLPRHVGLSLACDLAMKALCLAHDTLLNSSGGSLVQSRVQYGRALAELQLCIADPEQARTPGTLCAAMILGIFEQLLCADFGAFIRHAGGAARLIEAVGPSQFKEPFAYKMLNALHGVIVIECILYGRSCFLDSPQWRDACRNTETAYSHLSTIISPLPSILAVLRELGTKPVLNADENSLLQEQPAALRSLRHNLQLWRDTPSYASSFHTTELPSPEEPYTSLIYTSNKAVQLICAYSATMILINSALILLSRRDSSPTFNLLKERNLQLAKQICQSYKCSRNYSPVGSTAVDFALRVAYLVPDERMREFIVQKMNEMAKPLDGNREYGVKAVDLEDLFDYLRY